MPMQGKGQGNKKPLAKYYRQGAQIVPIYRNNGSHLSKVMDISSVIENSDKRYGMKSLSEDEY